eukprot:scaffold7634_cov417-Prasinococcus_capsulatus_cf.AAC.3
MSTPLCFTRAYLLDGQGHAQHVKLYKHAYDIIETHTEIISTSANTSPFSTPESNAELASVALRSWLLESASWSTSVAVAESSCGPGSTGSCNSKASSTRCPGLGATTQVVLLAGEDAASTGQSGLVRTVWGTS